MLRSGTIFFLFAQFCISVGAAPFEIALDRETSISLQSYGVQPVRMSAKEAVSSSVTGTEVNECQKGGGKNEAVLNGRKSSAQASAKIEVLNQDTNSLSLNLKSDVSAIGGHFPVCVTCVNGNCVGILPNDTKGIADAQARARVVIRFNSNSDSTDYLVKIGTSTVGSSPTIKFTDFTGKVIPLEGERGGTATVIGKPGALYYLELVQVDRVENEGECCSDQKSSSTRVDLEVIKAPLLASRKTFEPYIKGGEQTLAYESVGALLIDGRLHCTATLIASKTLLTAAHCLYGYENQKGKMTFIQGGNISQPTAGPFTIENFDYPDGSQVGYAYNPSTYEDDIGLVYLKDELLTKTIPLHDGSLPSWDEIRKKQTALTFVGFGYDVVGNQMTSPGIKREAPWAIQQVENRRVAFKVPGKNTCKGDSGGPAFLIVNAQLVQMAITSGGDSDCTTGFETRVDAYQSWVTGKVQ